MGQKVDARTNRWPVRPKLRAELEAIKYDFEACPLPVYIGERFIDPKSVPGIMKGALVEVQFELKHFTINKKKEDSFCAIVQQVLVLKPGETRPVTPYKRKIVEEGPVALHPALSEDPEKEGRGVPGPGLNSTNGRVSRSRDEDTLGESSTTANVSEERELQTLRDGKL